VSDTAVEVLIFEVAGTRYGADASSVLRIDRKADVEEVGTPLGEPVSGRRTLVFADQQGAERRLRVDSIEGVRTVPQADLRRLPGVAIASPISIGAWLDGGRAVLLVDLKRMAGADSSPRFFQTRE
jgi:chemotaxis signal transduction protein